MSTVVAFTFPWGRYHATPWDRNVNEGAVEWPPSPWRILRALYAVWKNHRPDLDDGRVHHLLSSLSAPPRYYVPRFCVGHTRHYFPGVAHLEGVKGKTKTDKTFDPFVATERDQSLFVEWDVDLAPGDRETLDGLLAEVGYLGRAESIVDAARVEGDLGDRVAAHVPIDPWAGDALRLLAPQKVLDFDALTMTPLRVRSDRRLDPPSTQWVPYPSAELVVRRSPSSSRSVGLVEAVRYSIVGNSPGARTSAVAFGDALRMNCLRVFGDMHDGGQSRQLAGKSTDGSKALGPHQHAHYLAFNADDISATTVDTLAVWSPGGLELDEVRAIARNLRLEINERIADVDDVRGKMVGLEGFGTSSDMLPELCATTSTWQTYTPYAMTRHWKGPIETQLRRDIDTELEGRGWDARVEYLELLKGDWLDYRRRRLIKNGRLADSVRPYGVEVGFTKPVSGPLALGSLSHFGLGLFLPAQAFR